MASPEKTGALGMHNGGGAQSQTKSRLDLEKTDEEEPVKKKEELEQDDEEEEEKVDAEENASPLPSAAIKATPSQQPNPKPRGRPFKIVVPKVKGSSDTPVAPVRVRGHLTFSALYYFISLLFIIL